MNRNITLYYHEDCLGHEPGTHHPENPGRLRAVTDRLESSPMKNRLDWLAAPEGRDEQIMLAHASDLLQEVKETAPESGVAALDADTVMSPGSLDAASRAVGAACAGIDELMSGSTSNVFCLTRPPGHHATPDRSMGFCIFNHMAIAALYAQKQYGLQRVAVVDFDVHHGNGTQDILQGKAGQLYISSHQSPHYPGTGSVRENIEHNIFNLPLQAGTTHEEYLALFENRIIPVLQDFQPELLLVSAGFDAHQLDPLGGLNFTEATYFRLGQRLAGIAGIFGNGRILSTLEGGYNLSVLGQSVEAFLAGTLEPAQA
jgi:acetoin utilization deacetylase AcuC-like enzyme